MPTPFPAARRVVPAVLLILESALPSRAAVWDEVLVHAGADRAVAVAITDDGGACVAGIGPISSLPGPNVQVTRLRADGTVVYQTTFGWDGDDLGAGVADGGEGTCVVVGAVTRSGNSNGIAARVSATGASITRFELGGAGVDHFTDVERTSDGGFIVSGTTTLGAGLLDAWLVKLRSDLSIDWQKAYGTADENEVAWALRTQGDDIVVVGFAVELDSSDRRVLLFKVDSAGTLLLQAQFGDVGRIAEGFDVATSCSGDVVVGGILDARGWLARVDGSGSLVWQRVPGSTFGAVMAVTRLDEQRVVTSALGGAGNSLLTAWQPDGSLNWQRSRTNSSILDIAVSADGGLWHVGYQGAGPTEEFRLTRADDRGAACADNLVTTAPATESLREQDSDIVVTPTGATPETPLLAITHDAPAPSGCLAPAEPGPWSKAWGAGFPPFTVAVATHGDGKHAVLSERSTTGTNAHAVLVDAAGTVAAERIYASPLVAPRDIVATLDGGWAIVGTTSSGDACVVRTNATLASTVSRRFGGPDFERVTAARELADGALLLAGTTTPVGGTSDAWAAVLEPLGTLRWHAVFPATGNQNTNDVEVVEENVGIIAGSTGLPTRPWLLAFDIGTGALHWDAQLDFGVTPSVAEVTSLAVGRGSCTPEGFGAGRIAAVGNLGLDTFFFTFDSFPASFGPVTLYHSPNGDFATSVVAALDGDFIVGGIRQGASPLTSPIPWLMRVDAVGIPSVDTGHVFGSIPSGRPQVALASTGYVLAHDNTETNEIVAHRIGLLGDGPTACPAIPLTRTPSLWLPIASSLGPIPSSPGWLPQPFLVTSSAITLPSTSCP